MSVCNKCPCVILSTITAHHLFIYPSLTTRSSFLRSTLSHFSLSSSSLSHSSFSFSLTLLFLTTCKHIRQPLGLIGSCDGVATTFHPCRDLTHFNSVTTSRLGQQHYLVDISTLPLLLSKCLFLQDICVLDFD